MGLKLKQFALKRAIFSACVAGIVNLIIVYFALRADGEVPLFASVAEIWNHSLIGALIPRSIFISFIITVTTMFATVKEVSNKSEDIYLKLKKSSWIKIALRKALIQALIAFIAVIILAYILRLLFPTYAKLSVSIVIPIVGIFAALVAFSMTYSAVFSTGKILNSGK
ncbi:MAG: hypothetical protein DHS20C13_00630 [Thermodesulfobacteriota bacterium]|nr:MAG: hypothetical protein DHS20C13_00630 [Thermodesulfobacteriota bacterium]